VGKHNELQEYEDNEKLTVSGRSRILPAQDPDTFGPAGGQVPYAWSSRINTLCHAEPRLASRAQLSKNEISLLLSDLVTEV